MSAWWESSVKICPSHTPHAELSKWIFWENANTREAQLKLKIFTVMDFYYLHAHWCVCIYVLLLWLCSLAKYEKIIPTAQSVQWILKISQIKNQHRFTLEKLKCTPFFKSCSHIHKCVLSAEQHGLFCF